MNRSQHKTSKQPPVTVAAKPASKDQGPLLIGVVILLTLIAFLPVFKAGFVNWDDDDYVVKNLAIRSFSNLKELMFSPVQGNYHPLTMISLALNYAVSGLHPLSYHVFNLILHLLNTLLVFKLASRLSKNNGVVPFTTALLFGIHPLHVESVAWVSERKDVLYAFFFLLGLISYVRYIDKALRKDLVMSFTWFVLSILSKPAAIIFPAALFTFDFFYRRKFSAKLFIEKIPFFLIAALFAYLTLHGQKTVGATDKTEVFTTGNRILFACYGYAAYFLKMIFPAGLSAFYPTPPVNQTLPSYFFAAPLFFIATVILCLVTWKKNRVITFGFAFYFVNLLLVLQFVVIGSALIAERYTYIPLIGLFFIVGWYLEKAFHKKPSNAYAISGVAGIILAAVTYNQAKTWKSGEALWENAIRNQPSSKAYVIRAEELAKKGNKEKALSYYSEAIKINKADPEAFGNRGNIYFELQQDTLALLDYNTALALNPDYVPALSNKGALYSRRGIPDEGLRNLNRALELNPDYGPAYKNRGTTYLGIRQYDKAVSDFTKYLEYEPDEVEIYNAIGVCYQNAGKYDLSIKPFTDAIGKDPQGMYYLNRSISWRAMGNIEEAKKDAITARERGLKLDPAYEQILGI
jgi:tetratricopeptide (TPR) repeat protein